MTTPNTTSIPDQAQPVPEMHPEPGDPVTSITHDVTQSAGYSPETEPIPDWLLEFARKITPVISPTPTDNLPEVTPPNSVLSVQERFIASQSNNPVEPVEIAQVTETQPLFRPKSIWEEEDAVELGTSTPFQIFVDPIDELKIMLDEDPQETVAFIRAHMHDAEFRSEATRNLRAYLTLDPHSTLLWQILEELQQTDSNQEA
ncbi:MAG: hypothetical protein WBI14_10065 [Anaerolineaceae bacterium]